MEVPRYWRTQRGRYSLVGVVCADCEAKAFPPRDVCPRCASSSVSEYRFSGKGVVYSYSMVYQAPDGFSGLVPYPTALVRLEEGPIVAAQLADIESDQLQVGMAVQMVTRRLGEDGPSGVIIYGYKFRPPVGQG